MQAGGGLAWVLAASLGAALLAAAVAFAVVASPAWADVGEDTGSNSRSCKKAPERVPNLVPGAEVQDGDCLRDLTTAGTQDTRHTDKNDWSGLNAAGTENPKGIPGLQVDGYFPDTSSTNTNNGFPSDAQFVIRFPNNWNGKVVITGAPGIREQYANDFIISDWVLARGYAFASTDKGNTGPAFYDDGSEPGGSVAEWHQRVEELTRATKQAAAKYYGRAPSRTYITGISNGGYLTRYALENTPELYDGGVDWEGTLFRAQGPNLFTYLPATLRNYPDYAAPPEDDDEEAFQNIVQAGLPPASEFLWDEHYAVYWDLTQRVYREEFDPEYDGPVSAGIPFCQEETPSAVPCDADYVYRDRPQEVKDVVGSVSLTGDIGKPMITLHGTLDALLPISQDSDVYRQLVLDSGNGDKHRYYVIAKGNHVDSYYDNNKRKLRPILPCHRDAFRELEAWVQKGEKPPSSGFVPKPKRGDVVNDCDLER